MADIFILFDAINPGDSPSSMSCSGTCRVSGAPVDSDSLVWSTVVSMGLTTVQLNAACIDAAIAVAQAAGFVIGGGDRKQLFSGAV